MLTLTEAAFRLGLSYQQAQRLALTRQLASALRDGKLLVSAASVEQLAHKREQGTAEGAE
jgi:hypothetical protein